VFSQFLEADVESANCLSRPNGIGRSEPGDEARRGATRHGPPTRTRASRPPCAPPSTLPLGSAASSRPVLNTQTQRLNNKLTFLQFQLRIYRKKLRACGLLPCHRKVGHSGSTRVLILMKPAPSPCKRSWSLEHRPNSSYEDSRWYFDPFRPSSPRNPLSPLSDLHNDALKDATQKQIPSSHQAACRRGEFKIGSCCPDHSRPILGRWRLEGWRTKPESSLPL